MKNRIIILATLIFLSGCGKNNFTLKAQIVDTVRVGQEFEIKYLGTVTGAMDGFGIKILYDSSKFSYISKETFAKFQFEDIKLVNDRQGKIGCSFTGTVLVSNLRNDSLLVIRLIVKNMATPGITKISIIDAVAMKEGKSISFDYAKAERDLLLQEINLFILKSELTKR